VANMWFAKVNGCWLAKGAINGRPFDGNGDRFQFSDKDREDLEALPGIEFQLIETDDKPIGWVWPLNPGWGFTNNAPVPGVDRPGLLRPVYLHHAPPPSKNVQEAVETARKVILEQSSFNGCIKGTLWADDHTTLVELLESALGEGGGR